MRGTVWTAGVITVVMLVPVAVGQFNLNTQKGAAPKAGAPAGGPVTGGNGVVINRRAVSLRDPRVYDVPLFLQPVRTAVISARVEGAVAKFNVDVGADLPDQERVLQIDSVEQTHLLARAKAALKAATLEVKLAEKTGDEDQKALAEARREVAQAEHDLATYRFDSCFVQAPFKSRLLKTLVTEGEFVRVGTPLVQVGDLSQMMVEVPVDRNTTQAGQTIELRVEDQRISGKVKSVLPAMERFGTLRELFTTLGTAVVVLENVGGKLQVGQAVYSELVPRDPVTEVPNTAVASDASGKRRVQVIRDQVVRNLPVQVLGSLGDDRVFVSAAFDSRDELILNSSVELADGTQLLQEAALEAAASKGGRGPARNPAEGKSDDF